ncbi:helix-turn-helix domain-containing protein [Cupriavidus sp. CP313]
MTLSLRFTQPIELQGNSSDTVNLTDRGGTFACELVALFLRYTATIRTIHQLGDRIRASRAGEGIPIDQAARHCGVSIDMLSKLENGKSVNFERPACDGRTGLTMLVVPKADAPWLEQAAAHAAQIGEDADGEQHTWLEE